MGYRAQTEDLSASEWDSLTSKLADQSLTPAQLDEQVWRADAYLYCVEVRCPETDWLVPLAPSWVIGEKTKTIARLIPIPAEKRYRIEILSGVSVAEMAEARQGTIAKGKIIHPILLELARDPGTIEQARLLSSRDQKTTPATHHPNGLRLWENNDLVPRPDDVFQERLYCIRWVETYRNDKGDLRTRKHYREVTGADRLREEKALTLIRERFIDWQKEGYLPSMKIEPGAETDRLMREPGWTHWHHLFNPRQLLVLSEISFHGGTRDQVNTRAMSLLT
jgi:putative DNA methylase